ncbi:MAG: sugar transferase, partial [Verrucomicrobia bacterium]|nr:sugar transferase [Verrucomicrobiota bacterium]
EYTKFAAVATVAYLFVLHNRELYVRPQIGSFVNKIPRLIKAVAMGLLLSVVLAFAFQNELQNDTEISRLVLGISFFTVAFLLLLQRYIMYRIEWNLARHSRIRNRVLILGTNSVAAHLSRTLQRETMLRSEIVGYLSTDTSSADPEVPADQVLGALDHLEATIERLKPNQIILTGFELGHRRILELMLLSERHLITFNVVPDLFRLMTSTMDVQSLDDIPLLGVSPWPLEYFWNRLLKRIEDVLGATIGLLLSAPVIGIMAILIKRSSPGSVFYIQERCGENGKTFNLYKLRTMVDNAEAMTGPVFASENDSRRTGLGTFLRRTNIDELPQFWNVLRGDMSLVGPRPERPHFVEQFKADIGRYMWRHVTRPGLTGWAQVNGLRGDTSIEERVKYDLYYLENWSLALDFKILLKTLTARQNAY